MSDEPDPPRKFFKLKPTEFETVNAPRSAPPADAGPTDVQGLIRAANAAPTKKPATPLATPQNDVHALLRENHERATALGLNEVAPRPKRMSRRKRDYFLLLIPVDAFLAYTAFGPQANVMSLVYGLGGIIFFSLGLTWVMWFVMDDY